MALWSTAPPEARSRLENKPTLLFSWWCTLFSAVIILMRISGRKVRSDSFYVEDKVMFLSLIPLFIRMGLIHVVLQHGTNNVLTDGLTAAQISNREIGSRLVLAARIFYAMFIWMSKLTVSEFLKRTFYNTWRQSYERVLHFIRLFLGFTFVAVVIATLVECQPFDHYWQVVPDPGPRCRQGFAQLITMGVADIITDILLVFFPIPIILRSHVGRVRKIFLILLFSASILMIGITGSRVPKVIEMHGRQQYRTVWASIEVLLSTFVANAVILGSFVRGTGARRNKYRLQSVSDSIERAPTRRHLPATIPDESDEDLFRSIGCRIPQELVEEEEDPSYSVKSPKSDLEQGKDRDEHPRQTSERRWGQTQEFAASTALPGDREATRELAAFLRENSAMIGAPAPTAQRPPSTRAADLSIADVGGLLGPSIATKVSTQHLRYESPERDTRSSRNLFGDIGGLFNVTKSTTNTDKRRSRASQSPTSRRASRYQSDEADPAVPSSGQSDMELSDVGGLLK